MTKHCYCITLLLTIAFVQLTAQELTIEQVNLNEGIGSKTFRTFHQQSSSYFITPSAYSVEAKAGYYQNAELIINKVEHGFSDRLSINMGIIPIFFGGEKAVIVWIHPKYSIPLIENKINFAVGPSLLIGSESSGNLALITANAVLTFGSRDRNISIAAAYGLRGKELLRAPIFAGCALFRVSDKLYLISENHFFMRRNGNLDTPWGGNITFGFRIAWKNVSVDLAVASQRNIEDGSDLIPWLSLSAPFGDY